MKKLILLSSILLSALTASATEGALKGKFTINAGGDQIVFSQGNLQYQPSTGTWRFATNQYDYITFDINAYSASSDKWIDLFAYGTSGYNNGQTNYQPYVVGAAENTYYQSNLTGNADWGYNAISNGGNTENSGWRTLTRDEWIYLFSGRTNAASKYGHGSINGVNGMILLPDKWTTPDGLSFTPGNSIWTNSYTIEQWNWMQKAGAVFLPASGSCNNAGIPSESLQNQNGFYRAGTAGYYLYFSQGSIQNCAMSFYQYGDAVRLVQAAPVEQYSLQQDEEGNYLIGSVQDWKDFAALVNGGSVKANAKMTANINLGDDQTMIGSGTTEPDQNGSTNIKYQGTFDGQGHTLTIHYVAEEDITAPFRFIQEATIKNLRVNGNITTAFHHAGGIVGTCFGQQKHSYIENCISSVNIISSYVNNGDFYGGSSHGGIAARLHYYGQLHITDCIFKGSISGENKGVVWGGILGFPDGTATFSNCLQIGTFDCSNVIGGSNGSGTISTVFSNGYASHININNCHYLNAIGNVQGTQATVEQLADGTTTTALQAGRAEEIWVQKGSTPMLKIFESESEPIEPTIWEGGALPGKFTINSNGDQIVFSQGNLQYRATTDTWRFAIYQYDMIGADNTNISATYDGWIDLIQWGAGNNPTTTDTYTYNTFVEFGSHAISNGGNVADAWRTMTNDEWVYIFHGRANAEDRVGLGSVNGITGVIILPDTWTTPDGLTFNPGPANGLTWLTEDGYYKSSATDCFSHNTYTSQQWGTMESNGAVFLPAAGIRYIGTKSIQQLGTGGYYWSSTKTSSTHANVAGFGANIINPQHNSMQDYGHSIRLVQAAPKPAQPSWVLAGDTWDEATKTLTVNSNPGVRAYQHKTDIVNLIFSDGVTNIGTYAFLECTSLISITFANTLTEIGSRAFDYCNNLPSVEIPNSVETIGEGAFYFCKNLISLTIGNNVKTIGEFAFYSCYALNSITIPNSVETIGKYAFLLAKSATSLTIGNSVKSIGEHAFYRCYALTSITIPGSVESIDKDAFGYCTGMTSVTCEAVNPPAVGKGIFSDSDKLAHIYVPAGAVANYKTAANWSDYAAIIEAIPGSENITVTWDAAFIDYVEAFNHLGTIVHYDNSKDGITVTYSGPASNIGKGMQSYIVKLTTSDKLTFTSTVGDIKKIEITYTSMSGTAPAGWTANDPTLTWEGTPAAAVELPGAIELPRITSIVFIVDKTATAIEEISQQPTINSQKLMIDGQLIIERDGKFFNAQGARLK